MANSERFLFRRGRLPTHREDREAEVLVEGGRIAAVGSVRGHPRRGARVVDCRGCWLLPGFVDIHQHGAAGRRTAEVSWEAFKAISGFLAMHGTTAFLMSLSACSREKMFEAITFAKEVMRKGLDGAKLAGIHFEGPYLSKKNCGGMAGGLIRDVDLAELRDLIKTGRGVIRMMTISPEVPRACEAIRLLAANGITAAAGHTTASSAEVARAIASGLRHVTHLCNNGEGDWVCRRGQYLEQGPLLEFLTRDELSVEVIVDGVHVLPKVVRMIYRLKGYRGTAAITDACAAAGSPHKMLRVRELDGTWRSFEVKNGALYIAGTNRLTGSLLTMDRAFMNIQQWAGLTPYQAAVSCCAVTARIAGVKTGFPLREGNPADLVVLRSDGQVALTLVAGKIVHQADCKRL